ncbi:MAG: group 1 glycosyl transferase, partial [Parcubacteria group bacterium Gr01-1014_106]
MRIVFLSARYPPDVLGGGEISTRLIAEALAAAGNEVSVLCGGQEYHDDIFGGVRILRMRELLPWWSKPIREVRVSRAMAQVVTKALEHHALAPDILHAHEFRSALTLSLLAHPHRVVTIRDYAPICGTTNNMWWDGSSCDGCSWTNVLFRCHRVVEASIPRKPFRVAQYKGNLAFRTRAYARIPHHVYTSAHLQHRVENRLHPPETIRASVIANPVDPAWVATPPTPLPAGNILCAAGRLETTKGTDVLLHALESVRIALPDVHLHCLGGGEVPRYQGLAARLGIADAVTFHGPISSVAVRERMDRSVAVLSPHLWEEPFGRAALESGARGRALIASDLGGVRETTTADTAFLVPPKDVPALAAACVRLLQDRNLAHTVGQAARR